MESSLQKLRTEWHRWHSGYEGKITLRISILQTAWAVRSYGVGHAHTLFPVGASNTRRHQSSKYFARGSSTYCFPPQSSEIDSLAVTKKGRGEEKSLGVKGKGKGREREGKGKGKGRERGQ